MTFIVRTIARTADGRQIVRPTAHDKDRIGIGRDASNAIHLPDLAVEPHHATLTMRGGGRVVAETVTGLGFTVDGKVVKRADIDAQRGAELRFGGHLLKLAMEDGVVTVSVERTEAVSDAAEEKDERTAFALAGLVPGKRSSAWAFLALVLIACLAWPVWTYATYREAKARPAGFHADTMWSSGPLSKAHHGLEGDCQACHDKAFVSVQDNKCATCHKGIHDHADAKRQIAAMAPPDFGRQIGNVFKAAFGKPTGQRCVDCHTEHEGAGPMVATASNFCADCHATMKTRLPDTKLANAGDFGRDHPQFRVQVVTDSTTAQPTFARVSLDARPIEDNGLKFPHDIHLSATNGVARMAQTLRTQQGWGNALACKDCHTPTADGVRFLPVDMERNCQACHALGFESIGGTVRTLRHGDPAQVVADLRAYFRSTAAPRPIALGGMARRRPGDYAAAEVSQDYVRGAADYGRGGVDAPFVKGGACYDCHIIDRTGDARTNGWSVRKVVQPMRYMMKGWFDHKAHATENCASCHNAAASHSASDLILPGIGKEGDTGGKSCRSCHGGEASAAKVPSTCATCHSYHMDAGAPWRPAGQRRDAPTTQTIVSRR